MEGACTGASNSCGYFNYPKEWIEMFFSSSSSCNDIHSHCLTLPIRVAPSIVTVCDTQNCYLCATLTRRLSIRIFEHSPRFSLFKEKMAKRAVCVLNGDVKGTIYFDQEVSEERTRIR